MFYIIFEHKLIKLLNMKSKLLIAAIVILNLASCTQRVMCPTYAVEDQKEVKVEAENKKSM